MTRSTSGNSPPTVGCALAAGFLIIAALLGMVAIVLPDVLSMIVVGGGMVLFFVFQYFAWGRWLHAWLVRQEAKRPGAPTDESSKNTWDR